MSLDNTPSCDLMSCTNTKSNKVTASFEFNFRILYSSLVFSGVCIARSLVFCFVERCLSFRIFSFGHCVVCLSSIYGF